VDNVDIRAASDGHNVAATMVKVDEVARRLLDKAPCPIRLAFASTGKRRRML
jgi:hypothetical protein